MLNLGSLLRTVVFDGVLGLGHLTSAHKVDLVDASLVACRAHAGVEGKL